jgi:protein-S-isoprenylcysteine O-methyltransferase Ste14
VKVLLRIPTQIVFVAGILILLLSLALRVRSLDGGLDIAGVVLAAGYLGWLLLEARVALGRPGTEARSDDRGTGQAIIVARMANVAGAMLVPVAWSRWQAWMVLPVALFFAGIALRRLAITTLGRYYSRRVRTLTDHAVVTHGPYRFVRHPAYTAVILAHTGMTLVLFNAVSAATLLLLVVPAFLWRISVEERLLLQLPEYAQFARGRRRLLPYVW